jgi:hypothetical protein
MKEKKQQKETWKESGHPDLRHIVEKRQDARERYVRHALATMRDPFEIWIVEYEDQHGKTSPRGVHLHPSIKQKASLLLAFASLLLTLYSTGEEVSHDTNSGVFAVSLNRLSPTRGSRSRAPQQKL